MKPGLGSDGRVVRGRRISQLATCASALLLSAGESPDRTVRRKSSLEAAESRRGSRGLTARKTIQHVCGDHRGSLSGGLFDKTSDPRTLARIEFEEAKRLSKEFHMDFAEVKQVIDIFYSADEDESGGLDKKELERALSRVLDVYVVPAPEVERAWKFMIGKRAMSWERMIDEVTIESFFHWYVENGGERNRVVSRSVRRRPSLVTQLGGSAARLASPVPSKLPPAVASLLPDIKKMQSVSSPSTRPSTSPSENQESPLGPESPALPTISVQGSGSPVGTGSGTISKRPSSLITTFQSPPVRSANALYVVREPLSPGASEMSEPLSPLSPMTPQVGLSMPAEQVEALRGRFDRFAEGSGVRGVLFYPQFILMFCDLFRIPTPTGIHQKWINSLWREIDVEKCGSVNFEAFCDWYVKYFDCASGSHAKGLPGMLAAQAH
jgi:hypothetical protein